MSDKSVEEFLAHHGVKGMKWGVRNVDKRDARSRRLSDGTATLKDKLIRDADLDGGRKGLPYSFRGETFKNRPRQERKMAKRDFQNKLKENRNSELAKRKPEIDLIFQKIDALSKGNSFDLDDGGGGKTQRDRDAGRKYIKLWDEFYKIELDVENAARAISAKQMVDDYGSQKIKDLKLTKYMR